MSLLPKLTDHGIDPAELEGVKADKQTFERGVNHAYDILKDKEPRQGEGFLTFMKRLLTEAIPEMKKRAEQDQKNDAAQQAFENLNKTALNEDNQNRID